MDTTTAKQLRWKREVAGTYFAGIPNHLYQVFQIEMARADSPTWWIYLNGTVFGNAYRLAEAKAMAQKHFEETTE